MVRKARLDEVVGVVTARAALRVTRYPTAEQFLSDVGPFLMANEAENALMIGVAEALVGQDSPVYFAAVHLDGAPVLAAFSNHPEKLGLTQTGETLAVTALVDDVLAACPHITRIGGPEPTVAHFVATFVAHTGRRVTDRMGTRIHRLDALRPPARIPPGRLRVAVEADLPTLVPWVEDFLVHIGDQGEARQIAEVRVRGGQVFVWEDEAPVSMAAWTGKTPNGVRVNLVYTPPALRGRGLASATVAALTQSLLDQGNHFCCLYTDVTNPISNAIYAKLGYQPVSEAALYTVPS